MIECPAMCRTFAALLVILLLAMTSWASACDLSCSLAQFHSKCNLPGTTASVEPEAVPSSDMAKMDMHNETSLNAQPGSHNGPVHLRVNSCTRSPCNETSVSAISAISKLAQHSVPALQLIAFDRPPAPVITRQLSWPLSEREPPNSQPFDPLSVSLRL